MSDVGQWNPKSVELDVIHKKLLSKAAENLQETNLGLDADELGTLRPVLRRERPVWESFAITQDSELLVGWIKALTLLERDVTGFELGDKSPVITLHRILKSRNDLPDDLNDWIKQHTNNRFLPYGNLFERI